MEKTPQEAKFHLKVEGYTHILCYVQNNDKKLKQKKQFLLENIKLIWSLITIKIGGHVDVKIIHTNLLRIFIASDGLLDK